jgi:SAM-dependent methyltransferase
LKPASALFEASSVSPADLDEAARNLADERWARLCLERGIADFSRGTIRDWMARLMLIAAHRLQDMGQALPLYARFLSGLDATTKQDWHRHLSLLALSRDLGVHEQSGRSAQSRDEFEAEVGAIVTALGPAGRGPVLDVGCGGGLWSILLARRGYRVIGTEHVAELVAAARRNAEAQGVAREVEFRLDDAIRSALPDAFCARALCIGVTPTLADDAAFMSLMSHLDRITRGNGAPNGGRLVILGSNRWEPSRMTAVQNTLQALRHDPLLAFRRLQLIELCWWLKPEHLKAISGRFPEVRVIAERHHPADGTRVDLLLE